VSSQTIAHQTGSTDIVLQVSGGGGLPPPAFMPDPLPYVTVYGDARVLALDQSAGAAVDRLVEFRFTEDLLQAMLHEAEPSCMLERDQRLDVPDVYDVGGTIFTANTDGAVHQTVAIGLGWDELAASIPEDQQEQRDMLLELSIKLTATAAEPGAGAPYEVERLGVFYEEVPGKPSASDWPEVAWPLEGPLATFRASSPKAYPNVRCGVVEGEDAATLLAALEGMPSGQNPYWLDGDRRYQLALRPMLPHETDCAALVA
jgi:hypothetical protein